MCTRILSAKNQKLLRLSMVVKISLWYEESLQTLDGCLGNHCVLGAWGLQVESPSFSVSIAGPGAIFPCVCWRDHNISLWKWRYMGESIPHQIMSVCHVVACCLQWFWLFGPRSTRASAPFPVTLCPPPFAALGNDGHHDGSTCTEPECPRSPLAQWVTSWIRHGKGSGNQCLRILKGIIPVFIKGIIQWIYPGDDHSKSIHKFMIIKSETWINLWIIKGITV